MKQIFLDIGELGWSLYLSAHLRWLKAKGKPADAVMTLPGRDCLYEGLVDRIFHAHWKHKEGVEPDCFGVYGMPDYKLRAFFNAKVPSGYCISESQPLQSMSREEIFKGEMIFKPYPYKYSVFGPEKEILVFPRYRQAWPFSVKNLPKGFYIKLINTLCNEFKDCTIVPMGTHEGAYHFTEIKKKNYLTLVGMTANIQQLIDRCQVAVGAVGSQSAPPKIMLLQDVPTFMIGHTRKRHQEEENWGKVKCGFWEVGQGGYINFNDDKCIPAIVKFLREVIK